MDVLAELLKVRCWFCFQKDLKNLFWNSIHCVLGGEPWAGSLVIGGYPSPFMCECYLTIKLRIYKMNFSYRITALELSTSI